jgi:hypothetical protein
VRVTNLTDQAIYALVERYTSLERIHLSYCENISVPAIFWLLERLTRLTHLSLTGVPSFRKPELQHMCRDPPREFNQHQRSAFCVYSGKGVHELRKFLQVAYSSDDPNNSAPFGELTPEVQRVRNSMANSRGGDRRHHSRHAGQPEVASITRGSTGQEHRTGLYHHHATRSEPPQNTVFSSSIGEARDFDLSRARLAPVGTSSRATATTLAPPSSSAQSAMQVDETTRDWDEVEDVAMEDSAAQTPTALMPSVRAGSRGPVDSNSTNQTFSFGRSSAKQDTPAFTGSGHRLVGMPDTTIASDQSPGRRTSTLAALATPPLATSNSFFPTLAMSAADQQNQSQEIYQPARPLPLPTNPTASIHPATSTSSSPGSSTS